MTGFFKKRHNKEGHKHSNSNPLSAKGISRKASKESSSFNILSSSMASPSSNHTKGSSDNKSESIRNNELSVHSKGSFTSPSNPASQTSPNRAEDIYSLRMRQGVRNKESGNQRVPSGSSTASTVRKTSLNSKNLPPTPPHTREMDYHANLLRTNTIEFKKKLSQTPWRKKRLYNSPFPRFSHAASSTTSDTGAIYLMGGLGGKNVFGDMWIIEPMKNPEQLQQQQQQPHDRKQSISSREDYPYIASPIENFDRMPAPRIGHACVLIGNAFIIFAGDTVTNSSQVLDNKLYFLNITSLKWTVTSPSGPRPSGRYGHQISVLNFEVPHQPGLWLSYLYVFGGQLEDKYYNDVWKFNLTKFRDPDTHWIKIKPSTASTFRPPPLANHTMTAFENKLYVYGGTDGHKVYNDLLCFDPLNETWSKCHLNGACTPPALQEHAAALYQNLLFIYGGKLQNDELSSDLYVIDLKTFNCWQIQSDLLYNPGPRCGHTLTADMVNEKLLVMGGDGSDKDFTNVFEDQRHILDESQFSFSSSIIYEFDLRYLAKYMERGVHLVKTVVNDSPQHEKELKSSKKSDSITEISGASHKSMPSTASSSSSGSSRINAKKLETERTSIPRDHNSTSLSQAVINAYGDDVDDDDEVVSSTPKKPVEPVNQLSASKSSIRSAQDPPNVVTTPTLVSHQHEPDMITPERAPERPVLNINDDNTTPEQAKADLLATNAARSPVKKKVEPKHKPVELVETTDNEDDEDEAEQDRSSTFASPKQHKREDSTRIESMGAMLNSLKKEMQEKVTDANNQIVKLEGEKRMAITELEKEKKKNVTNISYRSQLSVKDKQINDLKRELEDAKSELGKVSNNSSPKETVSNGQLSVRDRVHYENTILNLRNNNSDLVDKYQATDAFIRKKVTDLDELNNVIKNQQETISKLQKKLVSQIDLEKQVNDLTNEKKLMELELNKVNIQKTDKTIVETNSVSKLRTDIQKLVDVLNGTKATDLVRNVSVTSSEDSTEQSENKDATIKELQSQVDELLNLKSKEDAKKRTEIAVKEKRLRELEDSYQKSVGSLNSTHRALSLSQSEIEKLRDANKQLLSQIDDLKLNYRVPSSSVKGSPLTRVGSADDTNNAADASNLSDVEARYDFKIKDLEAELFIASQERDKLREELVSLKKKLYTSPEASVSSSQ